jgi:WhiB family redox-sensing transcriptional regulator
MTDWRDRAACRAEDPELFFPMGLSNATRHNQQQNDLAKAVCRRCPVASACLAWALESGEGHGVWGGMTADERRELLSTRSRRRRRGTTGTTTQRGRAPVIDLAEVAHLRSSGVSDREIAVRLGVAVNSIRSAEDRARNPRRRSA